MAECSKCKKNAEAYQRNLQAQREAAKKRAEAGHNAGTPKSEYAAAVKKGLRAS